MAEAPKLELEGMAPTEVAELRVFLIAFAEREGDLAEEHGHDLILQLHPAAPPLTVTIERGVLRASISTAACGPGLHALVCRLAGELRRRFSPDLVVRDPTGYFEGGERAELEAAMVSWRVAAGRRAAFELEHGGGPVLFGLPPKSQHAGKQKQVIVTPLRAYALAEWRTATDAIEAGAGAARAEHIPWWSLDKDAYHWRNRGLAYLSVRRVEGSADDERLRRALDACERARSLDPALDLPLPQLASACERLERPEQALAYLEAARERDPGSHDLLAWLARAYDKVGRRGEAASTLEDLSARCPSLAEVAYEAGLYLNAVEAFERALAPLERAVQLRPRKAKYQGELAVTLAALGRFEEALTALDLALAGEPRNLAGWENRVLLLEALDRPAEAEEARVRASGLRAEAGG